MAQLGVSKKKKSPRATELSQLKKEVQRLTEQLESRDREQTATSEILRLIATCRWTFNRCWTPSLRMLRAYAIHTMP
jgi:hypothetical protein